MTTPPAKLVVLASGYGSNFQAVIDACKAEVINAHVCALVTDQKEAYCLTRARTEDIKSMIYPKFKAVSRQAYDQGLADLVTVFKPDWVLLLGWMRILSGAFLDQFPGKVINMHPALPGKFPGVNAIERAFAAFQEGEVNETGVMLHFVPDEGVDDGPVITQATVRIFMSDTLETLKKRIHDTEHALLVSTLQSLCKVGQPALI
ncbi:MAG: phosphoribosylglycinamide formyltransferase [Patescibacteria group bacterium]